MKEELEIANIRYENAQTEKSATQRTLKETLKELEATKIAVNDFRDKFEQ